MLSTVYGHDKMLERIKQYIDYRGMPLSRFEKSIGLSNGYFMNSLKNKRAIGADKIGKILETYPEISCEWLLTGSGQMLIGDMEGKSAMMRVVSCGADPIPLVNETAAAGFGNGTQGIQESDVKAYYILPNLQNCDVDFLIEVSGDSMYPLFNSGDLVACSILTRASFIQWGRSYLLATRDQGLMVKKLMPGDDKMHIRAVSENPRYPEFHIPVGDITGMALVVASVRME